MVLYVLGLVSEQPSANANPSVSTFSMDRLNENICSLCTHTAAGLGSANDNSQAAYFLLQGQYGANNVVHLPTEV